jgi:MFS family permease
MGLVMTSGTLAYLLFGTIGGVTADRASRKRILVTCDAVAGVSVLSLSALMRWVPDATGVLVVCVCVVSALLGAVGAFFHPAMVAVTPTLVPAGRLGAANSLREASGDVAALVGQAVGGVAFRLLGAPLLMLIDGISYLFASASTSLASVPRTPGGGADGTPRPHLRDQLRAGFSFVREQRGLGSLVFVSTIANFFAAPFVVVLPFFVEDTLGASSDWFGYLIASLGAGGLLGYALAGTTARARGAPTLLACLLAMSVCVAALAWITTPFVAAAFLALAGLFGAVFNVGVVTLMQSRTPDAFRGRVFGLVQTLAMAATPAAMLTAGMITDAAGGDARAAILVCGAGLIVVSIWAATHRALRDYLDDRTPREYSN